MKLEPNTEGFWVVRMPTLEGIKYINLGTKDKAIADAIIASKDYTQIMAMVKTPQVVANVVKAMTERVGYEFSYVASEYAKSLKENSGLAWTTVKGYVDCVNMFAKKFGLLNQPVSVVTEDMVSQFINSPDKPIKYYTRRHRLYIIRAFCRWANTRGMLFGNPAGNIKRVKRVELPHHLKEVIPYEPMTDKEIATILKAADERLDLLKYRSEKSTFPGYWDDMAGGIKFLRKAIVIANRSGLRLHDVCCMEWDTFSEEGFMIVWTAKRHKRVRIPLPPEIAAIIKDTPKTHPRWVFPWAAANYFAHRGNTVKTILSELMKKLGIKGKSFHSLRVTYARRCAAEGVPTPHLSFMLAHSNTNQTKHYLGQRYGWRAMAEEQVLTGSVTTRHIEGAGQTQTCASPAPPAVVQSVSP